MKKLLFFIPIVILFSCTKEELPSPTIKESIKKIDSSPIISKPNKTYTLFKESVLNQKSGISFFWGYENYTQTFSNDANRKNYYGQGNAYHDINGDGFQDILVSYHKPETNGDGELIWFLNSGDNHNFEVPNKKYFNKSTYGFNAHKILKTDVNNDAIADFICLGVDERIQNNYTGNFTVLIGKTDGTYDVNDIPNPKRYWFHNGAAGDINGDGNVDVITAGFIWHGDGMGNFIKREDFDLNFYTNSPLVYEIVDLNNDKFNDLIIDGPFEPIKIVYNNGGVFNKNNKIYSLPYSKFAAVMDIEFKDYDNDGLLDIFTMNHLGGKQASSQDRIPMISQVIFYKNTNNGFVIDENLFIESLDGNYKHSVNDEYGWTSFKFDDIDGDGIEDIISENYQDGTYNGLKFVDGVWKKYIFKFGK